MRVLFITSFLPIENANQAGINFTYNLLKIIRKNIGCEVDILCTLNEEEINIDKTCVKEITKNQYIVTINKKGRC